jgi:hypothetical protein
LQELFLPSRRTGCLVEEDDEGFLAVFWGQSGELAAVLTSEEAREADNEGYLVLLD